MTGIDEDSGLWTGGARQMQSHAPIGDVGMIKSRLERFVLDEQLLLGPEISVHGFQVVFEPSLSPADVGSTWIVRSVCEPKRDVPAVKTHANRDAFLHMPHSTLANFLVRIAERTVLVFLVLKKIGIDGTGLYVVSLGMRFDLAAVLHTVGTVPKNVQCHAGADSS